MIVIELTKEVIDLSIEGIVVMKNFLHDVSGTLSIQIENSVTTRGTCEAINEADAYMGA